MNVPSVRASIVFVVNESLSQTLLLIEHKLIFAPGSLSHFLRAPPLPSDEQSRTRSTKPLCSECVPLTTPYHNGFFLFQHNPPFSQPPTIPTPRSPRTLKHTAPSQSFRSPHTTALGFAALSLKHTAPLRSSVDLILVSGFVSLPKRPNERLPSLGLAETAKMQVEFRQLKRESVKNQRVVGAVREPPAPEYWPFAYRTASVRYKKNLTR